MVDRNHRRAWLQQSLGWTAGLITAAAQAAPARPAAAATASDDDAIRPGRVLRFPADHGSHPGARTEWWYLTGALQPQGATDGAPRWGFQITFFRSRTGLAQGLPGRLAPRQLLFAHAALTDLGSPGRVGRHLHAQRLQRWNGEDAGLRARADRGEAVLRTADWQLHRDAATERWHTDAQDEDFGLNLVMQPTQSVLLQGEGGYSRKSPLPAQASHYYSLPQLQVQGQIRQGAERLAVQGRAWMDHEWSESVLGSEAVGWDWVGANLHDGGALTLFRLRPRAEGAPPVWAGGSHRDATGRLRIFSPQDLRFEPGRLWRSPDSGARYPVEWLIHTPVGRFRVQALLDGQEMDSRGSTGAVYWEGLSRLVGDDGRELGLGYLEMTGYAGTLSL